MLSKLLHQIAAELAEDIQEYRRRPSSAGPERCIRSMVYHASGVPGEQYGGRAVAVFDDSSWHAELVKDWLRKSAYHIHSEEFEIETRVGPGSIDGILTDLLGVDRLLELKAINHFSFERIWKGSWPLDFFAQCALYLEGLIKYVPEIREIVLLIKNKNTAQYMDILLRYDPDVDSLTVLNVERSDGQIVDGSFVMERICAQAVEKFDLVDKHVKEQTLPARPYEYGTDFPCGYCRWEKTCWGTYEEEFKTLSMDTELPNEVADMVRYRQEVGAHKLEIEKEYKGLSDQIKELMTAKGCRLAKAGEYIIEKKMQFRKSLKPDANVPDDAFEENSFEVMKIRKAKEAKNA